MTRVLITDDSVTAIKLLTFHLDDYAGTKFDILTAKDGADALFMLRDNEIDILFLDLEMPIINGYSVAEFINDRKLNVEIVIITANLDKQTILTLSKLGIKHFLPKPIEHLRMKNILNRVILKD